MNENTNENFFPEKKLEDQVYEKLLEGGFSEQEIFRNFVSREISMDKNFNARDESDFLVFKGNNLYHIEVTSSETDWTFSPLEESNNQGLPVLLLSSDKKKKSSFFLRRTAKESPVSECVKKLGKDHKNLPRNKVRQVLKNGQALLNNAFISNQLEKLNKHPQKLSLNYFFILCTNAKLFFMNTDKKKNEGQEVPYFIYQFEDYLFFKEEKILAKSAFSGPLSYDGYSESFEDSKLWVFVVHSEIIGKFLREISLKISDNLL